MKLPVNEIFYSLQGEGMHTGRAAVFVRLSGCNLQCSFCDTDHSRHELMEVESIVNAVTQWPSETVIVTGGEPSLYDLVPLTTALHAEGRRVHVETNGTHVLPDCIDWITCSPKKDAALPYQVTEEIARRADEVKVVYTGQSGEELEEIFRPFATGNRFLQPCSGANTGETVEMVLSHPQWRLSLQTHRLISIK